MHTRTRSIDNERGTVMVVTLLVLLSLTVLGLATIFLAGQGNEVSISGRAGEQALYVAEAGVNWAMDAVAKDSTLPSSNGGNGYQTASYNSGSGNADIVLKNAANGSIVFAGGQTATVGVAIGTDPDSSGSSTVCGIPGYSDNFGQIRFRITARGYGPGGAQREVEAHVVNPPQAGMCPAANFIGQGYPGG